MDTRTHLINRTMSSFPLSIGTGIMLESLFNPTAARYDKERIIPNKIKLDDYGYHVYNIFTLVRNILSSTSYPDKDGLINDKYFTDVVQDELFVLESLYSGSKCKPVFILPDYTDVCKRLNEGKSISNKKDHDMYFTLLNRFKKIELLDTVTIIKDKYILPKFDKPILITTSYPVDLLNKGNTMSLLESHTGKLKPKYEWNTKYHKLSHPAMLCIPFLEELLYVFGDGNIVYTDKLAIRTKVLEIAELSKWTNRTTYDKVLYDIKKNDLEIYDKVLNYKKIY